MSSNIQSQLDCKGVMVRSSGMDMHATRIAIIGSLQYVDANDDSAYAISFQGHTSSLDQQSGSVIGDW